MYRLTLIIQNPKVGATKQYVHKSKNAQYPQGLDLRKEGPWDCQEIKLNEAAN